MFRSTQLLLCLAAFAAALCFSAVCGAQTFTLDEAVRQALKANPNIEAKIQALERASMNIGVAQSYFWPRASLVANKNQLRNSGSFGSADELSNDSRSQGLRVSYSLFSGFSHLNNLQRSMIEKDIAQLECRQAELELTANVEIQFFTLLKERRNLRLEQESIRRIKLQLKAAEAFSEEGMAPYINVLQNRVELSRANEHLIQTKNAIRSCEVQLNRFLGFEPDSRNTFKGNLEDFSRKHTYNEQEALRQAKKFRPDVLIAQKSIIAARKGANATAGDALPKVDVTYDNMTASRDYRDTRFQDYDRSYWSVGVNFTWTFFEGGKTAFAYAADKKQVGTLEAAYKNTLAGAETEVIRALLDIRAAQEVFVTARQGVKAAEESYAQARYRYDANVGTITELIDAQTRLTEADVRVSAAMADYQISRAKFFFYTGENPAAHD